MSFYWNGAFEKLWTQAIAYKQYAIFPPFYMYFLAGFFGVLNVLGCIAYALPLVIFFNVLLYSLSSYIVYLIVRKLSFRPFIALVALAFYAFSYTGFYMNALVLPDNLASVLLVFITGVFVLAEMNLFLAALVGVLLGVALAAKPFFVLFSIVFLFKMITLSYHSPHRWVLPVIFIVGLMIVPLWTIGENYHMSNGRLSGLGFNGGVNFLEGWGEVGKIDSQSHDGNYWVRSSGSWDEPTWKTAVFKEPFYHQGYYYRQGLSAIKKNPSVLYKKIFWFGKLFFGSLNPTLFKSPDGYNTIMPWFERTLWGMFLSLGLLYLFFIRYVDKERVAFLYSLLGVFFISIYLLGMPERRYLYYIEFLIPILFFITVDWGISLYRIYKKEIWLYVFCVFSLLMCVPKALCAVGHFLNGG